MKLNIGCGKQHLQGYINIDIIKPCDVQCKAWELPYRANTIEEINCDNLFDSLTGKEFVATMREFYKVLDKGGLLKFRVFNAPSDLETALQYPHASGKLYSIKTFHFFDKDTPEWQTWGEASDYPPFTKKRLEIVDSIVIGEFIK